MVGEKMQFVAWFQSMTAPWGTVVLFGGAFLVLLGLIWLCAKFLFGNGSREKEGMASSSWQFFAGEELTAFLGQQSLPEQIACGVQIIERGNEDQKETLISYLQTHHCFKSYLEKLGTEGYPASYGIVLWPYLKEEDFYFVLLEKFRVKCSLDEQLAAKEFFQAVQEKAALPYLLQGVVQPEKYVLSRIAEALIPLGVVAGRALGELLSMVCSQTALGILAILEQMPGQFPIEPVIRCLDSEEWTLRMAAIHVLAQEKNAAPHIITALTDRQWQVRAAAVKALSEMHCLPARERIGQMAADESKGVRIAVAKAMEKLS